MKLEVTDLAKTILSHLADIQNNRGSHISSFWQICNSLDSELSLNDFESMALRNFVLVPFKDKKIGYEEAMLLTCTKVGSIKKSIEADFSQHCEDFGCECGKPSGALCCHLELLYGAFSFTSVLAYWGYAEPIEE
ncbi:hypothetical protein AB4393_14285 [Vibrio splendidus]